jgi:hypothetical protein
MSRRRLQLSRLEIEQRVHRGTEELLARVWTAFASAPDWEEGMRCVAWELFAFLREDGARARLMVIDVLESTPEAIAIREFGIEGLTALIDAGREGMDDPASLGPQTAEVIAGTVYNRIHVAVENGVEGLDPELVRELMYTVVLPYRGRAAARAELRQPGPVWAEAGRPPPPPGAD